MACRVLPLKDCEEPAVVFDGSIYVYKMKATSRVCCMANNSWLFLSVLLQPRSEILLYISLTARPFGDW